MTPLELARERLRAAEKALRILRNTRHTLSRKPNQNLTEHHRLVRAGRDEVASATQDVHNLTPRHNGTRPR
jgi:hypothetical protein